MKAMDGQEPWAGWPEQRSMATLTTYMTAAARANCPLVVSFLRWAGAWPFFSVSGSGATPLHAAVRAGHVTLVEAMVRDLGASLYTPDTKGKLPRDMEQLPSGLGAQLEEVRSAWSSGGGVGAATLDLFYHARLYPPQDAGNKGKTDHHSVPPNS